MTRHAVLVATLALSVGCATRTPPQTAGTSATAAPHENLNATLWVQTALEYEATALQAYRLAQAQLDAALGDRTWTAAI
jgi:predicted secreted acid phosphatase